ncbi:aminotransferase class V-fold PLP-dependent enzyme [bacterium]|nr:aminotransferase class V-fold PLP-dependent enzyme [bacterium]
MKSLDFTYLRNQIVGIDSTFETPFGKRMMVYCDYTASGRCLKFIEKYIARLQRHYANTHTEDDITGRSMTRLLRAAETAMKHAVNAGPDGCIIAIGTGSTAAIDKFQQIVGIALPPATRHMLLQMLNNSPDISNEKNFEAFIRERQPVVFVGPYEHHSNEVTWREGLATVIQVRIDKKGRIDLKHLEELLQDPAYENRMRIGSFSAASNVTGIISPVHTIARLLHKYNALACFDYAASAPYVTIDMNPDPGPEGGDPSLDAIFISPHKFIGGPGSAGVLIFNKKVYNQNLAPSVSGGGTVDYVSSTDHEFLKDIEEREKAGTPGVLQIMKSALVFEVKESIGVDTIARREEELYSRAVKRWGKNPNLSILGLENPDEHIAVMSFNAKEPDGKYLHPKFVTVLLNDLFGIQSRAGCSCAGPYGHYLMGIDQNTSLRYKKMVVDGYCGIKPGWCRIGFHYTMDDAEADYLIDAVDFIGHHGHLFLKLYTFDLNSGYWCHKKHTEDITEFSLEDALRECDEEYCALPPEIRSRIYRDYLREALDIALDLEQEKSGKNEVLAGELGELQYFTLQK